MQKTHFIITTLLLSSIVILYAPAIGILILIGNACICVAILALQMISVLSKAKPDTNIEIQKELFVSIHVPCHNEPSELVKKTLESLSKLEYENYEVIVVDNNTHSKALWKPVQEYCNKLGSKFIFLHFEQLAGYKAGALNQALQHMNPKTDVIAIIDSDYIVDKNFLKNGIPYFNDPTMAIVQYPQDYYNGTAQTRGMQDDYRSFFDIFLQQANTLNAVTATGTLSLLRASLFSKDSIAWNTWCITEDAEISIHLHSVGYKGIFINHITGLGLMPFDYASLQRQRERWVFGNTQIIKKDILPLMSNKKLHWKQKMSFITQLTAWTHPFFFPVISLIISFFFASVTLFTAEQIIMCWISIATILVFTIVKGIFFSIYEMKKHTFSLSRLLAIHLSHFGLTSTMSFTWPWAFTSSSLPFNRTTKDPKEKSVAYIPMDIVLIASFILTSFVAIFTVHSSIQSAAIISTLIGCYFATGIFFLTAQTRASRHTANNYLEESATPL